MCLRDDSWSASISDFPRRSFEKVFTRRKNFAGLEPRHGVPSSPRHCSLGGHAVDDFSLHVIEFPFMVLVFREL